MYVDQNKTSKMMSWLATKFSSCTFVNYEQLNMNDRQNMITVDLSSTVDIDLSLSSMSQWPRP